MSVNNKIKLRKYSLEICGKFDELLESSGISIPDDDRTSNPEEANIYGTTYFKLEEEITEILVDLVKEIKENPDTEIDNFDY